MKYKDYELLDELLYNKDSSWIKIEDGVATIGLIEPIVKVLKEFLFVKLPEKNEIKCGNIYVSLETLKWSGHFSSPLSGEIIEVNNQLYDEPEKINKNPYLSWIIKIKLNNKKEIESLFKPQEIIEWLDKTLKGGN